MNGAPERIGRSNGMLTVLEWIFNLALEGTSWIGMEHLYRWLEKREPRWRRIERERRKEKV